MHTAIISISINIIAAISWPPLLISQLFLPRLLKPHLFFTAWLFCVDILSLLHFYLCVDAVTPKDGVSEKMAISPTKCYACDIESATPVYLKFQEHDYSIL